MGAFAGCCVLWSLSSPIHVNVVQLNRHAFARLGISMNPSTEVALLHLQFAGLGFTSGSVLRYLGWRKDGLR